MQQSSFKLSLQIGASIAQSFTTALKGSEAQLGHLGACIDKLKHQQTAVNKVSISDANVGKARIAYEAASKELVRLRRAMQSTTAPSKALQQQYEQAKQKLERLSGALETQRTQLQRHRSALQQEGLASTQTANAHAKLGASLTLLTAKYQRLS